jgi:hypothetical protein
MSTNPCCLPVTSFDLSKAVTFSRFFSKIALSPTARLVIICLTGFYNYKKGGLMFPGQKIIAECTGASEKSITNAVNELRSTGLILTVKKNNYLNYYFTQKFFDLVKVAGGDGKNCLKVGVKIADTCHEQIKKNKVTNNSIEFLRFDKNIEKTRILLDQIEKNRANSCSPLDFTKEQAEEYLKNLLPELKNSYFARELRKKWSLVLK